MILSPLSLSSLLLSHIHCLDRELQVFFHLGLIKKEKSISFSAITVFSIWSFETVRGSEIEFPERKSCLMDPSKRFLEGEISAFSLACHCVGERTGVNTDGRLEVIMTSFDCPGFYWPFFLPDKVTGHYHNPNPKPSSTVLVNQWESFYRHQWSLDQTSLDAREHNKLNSAVRYGCSSDFFCGSQPLFLLFGTDCVRTV